MNKYFLLFELIFFLFINCLHTSSAYAEYDRKTPVVKAVQSVRPAVVNISSEYEVRKNSNPFSGFGFDHGFDSFFKDFFDYGYEQKYKRTSLGSGVIIDGKRGFILTNSHVITKAGTITVVLKDEREFTAQIIGADPDSDLAVLRISSTNKLPSMEMGNSDDIMIGETVIAIGNPFGFSNTVTTGVISAVNRSIKTENRVFHDFIQTDASINPGNSGGPLLNINGELIGINTAIYAKAQGIGFAIPINKAKRIVTDLIRYGEVVQPWIGITIQEIDETLSRYLNLKESSGVLIKSVEKKGPSQKAGITAGDIIMSISQKKINFIKDYNAAMNKYAAGDTIPVTIWRNGRKIKISVSAKVYPRELAMDLAYKLLGITVKNISFKHRFNYKTQTKEGVVISELRRESYLAHIGVIPGDIIRQIDEVTINNVEDFEKAIVKYRKKSSLVILLQRDDNGYYITVKF